MAGAGTGTNANLMLGATSIRYMFNDVKKEFSASCAASQFSLPVNWTSMQSLVKSIVRSKLLY